MTVTNEMRHGISRERLEQLLTELDAVQGGPIGRANDLIDAAGLTGDSYLVQCLLWDRRLIWIAWNMPEVQ